MSDEFRIRRATTADLALIMRHRIAMFRDMGATEDQLAAVARSGEPYFASGLSNGNYQGWFFEDGSGRAVAGGGVTLVEYQPGPRDPTPRRPWVVNVYTEPAYRRRDRAIETRDDRPHADHRARADDHAKHRQERPELVRANRLEGKLNAE